MGISPDWVGRSLRGLDASTPLGRYARDPQSLSRAVDTWRGASRHFLVQLAPLEVRDRVAARLAAMTDDERRHWTSVLARTKADADSLAFLALSLDTDGRPIAVASSDPATRLFLGDGERARGVPDA